MDQNNNHLLPLLPHHLKEVLVITSSSCHSLLKAGQYYYSAAQMHAYAYSAIEMRVLANSTKTQGHSEQTLCQLSRNEIDECFDGLTSKGNGKSRYDIARAIETKLNEKL